MRRITTISTLVLIILLSNIFSGITLAQGSIVKDYPDLKLLVDFIGEEKRSRCD
jgi:hypothetical protein